MSDSDTQDVSQVAAEDEDQGQGVIQPSGELPGNRLRAHREMRHMTREEVAHHLRLDAQLIKALEEDDYTQLPSAAYICGYLRSYARLLKLPEDEIVRAYSHGEEINAALIPENVSILPKKTIDTSLIKIIVIALVALLVVAGMYLAAEKFGIFGDNQSRQPVSTDESGTSRTEQAEPVVISPLVAPAASESEQGSAVTAPQTDTNQTSMEPAATSVPEAGTKDSSDNISMQTTSGQSAATDMPEATESKQVVPVAAAPVLRLHYLGDSWTEVTDATGKRLVFRLVDKNSDLNLQGEPPFKILLGNAPEVEVFFNGKKFEHDRYQRDDVAYFRVGKQQ